MDNEPLETQQNKSPAGVSPTAGQPPITPPEDPVTANPAPSVATKRDPLMIWVLAGVVTISGIMLLYPFRSSIIPTKPAPPDATITPLPSPTPMRILSAIATQSAFMGLEQNSASVSAAIANTNLDEPSLTPPNIDLPLGFIQ